MKPHLILIRGIPGAGKTTFAETIIQALDSESQIYASRLGEWEHFENDMWQVDGQGKYDWQADRVPYACAACFRAAKSAIRDGRNVIVSNTFTKHSDYREYLQLAKDYDCKLTVLTVEGDHGSIHSIPEDKMDYFRQRMKNPFKFC